MELSGRGLRIGAVLLFMAAGLAFIIARRALSDAAGPLELYIGLGFLAATVGVLPFVGGWLEAPEPDNAWDRTKSPPPTGRTGRPEKTRHRWFVPEWWWLLFAGAAAIVALIWPLHEVLAGESSEGSSSVDPLWLAGGLALPAAFMPLRARMRRRAERHAELEQLALLPADNPNPMWRIGPAGEARYANPAARALLDRIAGDPGAARRWRELLAALRQPIAAGSAPADTRFVLGNSCHLIRCVGAPTSDCLQLFALEITELVSRERQLRASESRLSLAIRTARMGLFEIDVPMRTILINDIYAWQLGLGPVEIRKPLADWAELIHPDDRAATMAALDDFTAGRAGRFQVEHRLNDGRGDWIWVSARAEVIEVDSVGMPSRILGSHLDITELKRTESALERMNMSSQAKLNLVSLGDSGSESEVLASAADHAAKLSGSDFGVMHLLRAEDGSVEASFAPGSGAWSLVPPFVFRRAVEIRVSGRVVARVEVAGKSVDYTADDEWTLQLLGSEAWNVVQRMRQSRKLEIQSRVLECAINGIVIADAEGHLEWANPAFEQITGYPLTEVIGHRLNFLRSGQHDDAFYKRLWENLSAGRSFSGEFVNRRKDGTLVKVLQAITPVLGDDGRIERYISVSEDVTIRKSADDRLIFLAEHDELTGLLNRATLIAAIDQAIAESDRIGEGFAVLYLGIDHFKTVNERLGRLAGNAVLQRIAAILGDCVRPTDSVARCGGDEFAVLQRFAGGPDDAATLARRLVSALAAASDDPSDGARLGASIGISVFPADQGRAEALLMNAELAMHRAKLETRGSLRYFTLALHETAMTKARLSGALPAAIRERQIFLLYQPIVELSGGRLIGCEALARWRHPTLGMLPPAHFIAIAEETGMIRELGLHILRRAIEEFGAAMSEAAAGGMTLSVNLSFGQFSEAEFIDEVRDELASSGFPANRLELELTESMLALEPDRAIETTRALVELGCTLAIDDFGTGYSSLPQLRRYGVDSLKIDRSFITDLAEGEGPQAVVRATIAMAHSLGMAIIAEGVETQEQADFLRGEGAEYSQGYLFGRPMAIEELAALWRAGIADPALTQSGTAAPGQPRPVARAPRNTHPGSAKIH